MKASYERLLAHGKLETVALVAVMHKMLTRMNAMHRTRQAELPSRLHPLAGGIDGCRLMQRSSPHDEAYPVSEFG